MERKKINKTQGWEEAGLEFYQESYPSNPTDFDVLQPNPKHLATLLPSKQNRTAATMRLRGTTDTRTRTFRRQQTMRRESTIRRASMAMEVQVSMMPDLSQNLSNEEKTWQEIMEIKAMPITMSQKREMKSKLQSEPNLRLQGYDQFKWRQRKLMKSLNETLRESYKKIELWRTTLKNIEGKFGSGVVAYFLLIKWLMLLNLAIFGLVFLFVILPAVLLEGEYKSDCEEQKTNSTSCCSARYRNSSHAESQSVVLDLFQGTGKIEHTLFFYGVYTNSTYAYSVLNRRLYYNLPLAYVCVTVVYFLLSLFLIIRAAAKGFKERLVEGEGQFYHYCNMVFSSWDYCVDNEKSAGRKHEAIFKEVVSNLELERLEEERKSRTRDEKSKLLAVRVIVNFLVVTILLAAAAVIYFVFNFSTMMLTRVNLDDNFVLKLCYEFLPSVCIVLLNLTVPFVFQYLVDFENYSPVFVVRITLVRTVFLRLFSLFILYASLYYKVSCKRDLNECASSHCNTPLCWETYVGQQMYKLAITDFSTHIFTTFVINFVRSRIGLMENKFAKFIGEQNFALPKHVLDVVYLQTVCWFGTFYAPFIPLMFVIIFFIMFYIKRFACLVNSKPGVTVYRASRSNSMFMIVLLVSFTFALLPVVFTIAELTPSRSCGPFRGLTTTWVVITDTFINMPGWVQSLLSFSSTAGFAIPIFIVLSLSLYYYIAVTSANRHMVIVLKHQLVLEGHDKQFLLEKLSSFIKQQQQQMQKRNRLPDMREGDRNVSSN